MLNLIARYKAIPIEARAAIWFVAGNLMLKCIGVFSAPLFTRLIPPSEYGILAVMTSWQQLILIFSTWEIPLGAYQKGIFKYKDDLRRYTMATLVLDNIITIIIFSIIAMFYDTFAQWTMMSPLIQLLLFFYLLTQPAFSCWMVKQRTDNSYKAVVFANLSLSLLSILIPLLFILYIAPTAEMKYAGTLLAMTLGSSFFYIKNLDFNIIYSEWEIVKKYWLYSLRFEAPLVLHAISYLLLGQSDRVMIGYMIGTKEAAFYSIAYTLGTTIGFIQSSILSSMLPWNYRMMAENKYVNIGNVTNGVLCIFATVILIFILVAPELMRILFTEDYFEAIWCIPPIASSLYFLLLYSLFVNIETYYEENRYVMYVSLFCSALNVALNYLLLPFGGYIVCAYTTLVCYIVFAIGHNYFMNKIVNKHIPGVIIYNGKMILIISMMVVIGALLIDIIYPYALFRYVLLLISIAMIWKYRKSIREILAVVRH